MITAHINIYPTENLFLQTLSTYTLAVEVIYRPPLSVWLTDNKTTATKQLHLPTVLITYSLISAVISLLLIKHKPWKTIHSQSVPPTEHVCYTKRKPSLTRLASQVQSLSNLLNTNGIPLYTQKSIQLQRVEFMKDSSIFIRSQPSREEDNGWPPSVFVSNISHCGLTKHEITK